MRAEFPDIPRRVSGYNLDQLLPENGFHVARALVGSEGTCVNVLEATVRLVLAADGAGTVLSLQEDASAGPGRLVPKPIRQLGVLPRRRVYVHVARGSVTANGTRLEAGDALKLTDVAELTLADGSDAEVLVFDLPGVTQ